VSWQREHAELEPSHAPQHEGADPAAPLRELVSSVGNRAFARQVDGILPGGQVHPAVQSEINASRGSGASLDSGVQDRFSGSLGDLSDVRVHTDEAADRLNRSSPRARSRRAATSTSRTGNTTRARRRATS
jgi:hypothetical protein